MEAIPLYRVNAFTNPAAKSALQNGNPAAIALLSEAQSSSLSDATRQAVAKELNLSETAFVTKTEVANTFKLRWFTPETEVALCGHATLAAAQTVLVAGWATYGEKINFETKHYGALTVTPGVKTEGSPQLLCMRFPLLSHRDEMGVDEKGTLLRALGVAVGEVRDVYRSVDDVVVLLQEEGVLRGLEPDYVALGQVQTRGVIVAAAGSGDVRFSSRFFAPRVGIAEDPVTGSAHSVLASIFVKAGERVHARQLSPRGGWLWVERTADDRVLLSGGAMVVVRGEAYL